jgi:hypothetical protein
MDAAYIKSTVSAALIEGLSILSRTNPEDPVDYLGKWLVKQADFLDQVEQVRLARTPVLVMHTDSLTVQMQQKLAVHDSNAHATSTQTESKVEESKHPDSGNAAPEEPLALLLSSCQEVTDDVLRQFCDDLAKIVGASGVYIAEKLPAKPGTDEGEGSGSNATMKYISASDSHQYLLERTLREADGGVTWKSWVLPETSEEATEEEATGDEPVKAKAAPVLPTIHISNVLKVNDVYFHQLPRPGAYVAAPIEYGTLVHENALPAIALDLPASETVDVPETADSADGEQAAPAPADVSSATPPGNPKKRFLAVCMDSMGQNRDFTPQELILLDKCVSLLKATLLRTELVAYEEEYKAAKEALSSSDSLAASAAEKEKEYQQGLWFLAVDSLRLSHLCVSLQAPKSRQQHQSRRSEKLRLMNTKCLQRRTLVVKRLDY